MSETQRIADQLKRAFEKDAWHGPSVLETLQGITAEQAIAKPIAGAHSIWEIVLHVSGWQKAVRQRVEGKKISEPEGGDWPEVKETTHSAWERALQNLKRNYQELLATIQSLQESDLEKKPPGSQNSNYIQLHGIIQHNLYHAGQMAVLRKALS